jgi:S-formylglutathione hydrolase FrmB
MRSALLISLLYCFCGAFCQRVDSVVLWSQTLQKNVSCVVITPTQKGPKPLLILLHGYSGNHTNWINKVPQIKQLAQQYGIAVICPDGGYDSWYLNSTLQPHSQYTTYFGTEFPTQVDSILGQQTPAHLRGIAGLSMGGHGAFYIGLQYPTVYGAVGATSGGMNLESSAGKFGIQNHLGVYSANIEAWKKNSIVTLVKTVPKTTQALWIDCGTEDFFYADNEQLHTVLLQQKIPHHYLTMAGKHDWNYWAISITYQFQFFHQYFTKNNQP